MVLCHQFLSLEKNFDELASSTCQLFSTTMNIHWHEQESPFPGELQAQMVDLSFRLSGRQLQWDCALTLYYTIAEHLKWITHEPRVGILLSLGPSSANGWQPVSYTHLRAHETDS